jgi:carbonic anhydrase/acetyltransferase-like protein (isoleucine patch superfamily)
MLLPFGGKVPRDEGAVFVAPNATVLGDVVLGPGSSVWYGAVLRGDDGTLTLGENTNVQDNAVLHCDPGGAVTLGKNVTVGHCALVHGCTVGDGSLIGMHATLLNHCVVGKNCIIGAGALVPEGMVIPDGSVAVGVPARVIKPVTEAQIEANLRNAEHYVEHGKVHARALKNPE